MNDPLSEIVGFCHAYLAREITLAVFNQKLAFQVARLNENEAKQLADVIASYAIHLRTRQ